MANRVGARGLMFVGADRHVGERNKFIEAEICLWIEALLDDCIPPRNFDVVLRDGVLLCRAIKLAINVLKPGSVSKIEKPFTKEAYTKNVNSFIKAAESFGLPSDRSFSANDLVEGEDIPKVINALLTLGRLCYEKGWEGAALGPKPTGALKDWPETILRASEAIIPLQYGTNKKGMRIGGQRDVLPHIKGAKKEGEEEPKDGEPRNNPSESILPMQCGSFKGATQKGLKIGTIRDVLPHVQGGELPKREGDFNLTESILPMQCGSFKGATQKGIKIGTIRDVLPHVQYRTADTAPAEA